MLYKSTEFSFGCEHEWADIDTTVSLAAGYEHNKKDFTVVNSNGIANDPSGKLYHYGGEINTPPTSSPEGQVRCLEYLLKVFPEAKVNYRSNLHVHIRVPGLRDDLHALKRVQRYIHEHMTQALKIIEPIPYPTRFEYPRIEEYNGAFKRYRRRRVSHHTLLTPKRLAYQLAAKTVDGFFAREVPRSDLRPLWHLQPRLCVNLRQIRETDTIEYRHFPGTLDSEELLNSIRWCSGFMQAALDNDPIEPLLRWARSARFPKFPEYVHDMEVKYRATVHDGTVPKDQIAENIKAIEQGRFKG